MNLPLVDLEGLVFLMTSIPVAFYILSLSTSMGSVSSEGRGLMETSNLRLNGPRSLNLSYCLTISLYLSPFASGRRFFDEK